MFNIYKKITKFETVISYFACRDWKFHNDNTQGLWNSLPEADKTMFPFSMKELDWEDYHKTHVLGLRIYLVKDDLSTMPQAMIKWRRFYVANKIIKTLFVLLMIYLLYCVFSKLFFQP